MVFNESLKVGRIPSCMKLAEVIPLHKGNSKEEKSNYRPISFLQYQSFRKRSESQSIRESIGSFLTQSKSPRISIGLECSIVSEMVKNLEKNWNTTGMFLDLSKVFDTIEHKTVYKKLERYRI